VITDPTDPTKTALIVGGTNGNDTFKIDKSGSSVKVTLNGVLLGTFGFTGSLFVLGQNGDDTITLQSTIDRSSFLYGGNGKDTITAGNGTTVAIGGDGNDTITTGNGRDVLIGGRDVDSLSSGNGEDLLIGGRTSYDTFSSANATALRKLRDEWLSGQTYATRINRLRGITPGSAFVFNFSGGSQNVFDDAAADRLTGGNDNDWFIGNFTGSGTFDLPDKKAAETATDL